MAKATRKVKVVKQAVVIPAVTEETITLELDRTQAEAVYALVGTCSGEPTRSVFNALHDVFNEDTGFASRVYPTDFYMVRDANGEPISLLVLARQ